MADQPDMKALEMRLTRIEEMLKGVAETQTKVDFSAEELSTYMKVRDALDPGFCGPNDCLQLCIKTCVNRCVNLCVNRCITRCVRCINECVCGPCNCFKGSNLAGFVNDFSDMGD
jgi:hypothetical protein